MPDNLIYAGPRHRIRRWRNYGIASGPPAVPVVFLFRDDFLTDEAAPLTSPRTAEPGPGEGIVFDTANELSISGGAMRTADITGNADPSYDDNGGLARISGRACFVKAQINQVARTGWHVVRNALKTRQAFRFVGTALSAIDNTMSIPIDTIVIGEDYISAIALRTAGGFYLMRGGIFASWTLVWVGSINVNTPLYGGFTPQVGGTDIHVYDYVRISDLPSPWDTDYGIATDRLAGARTPVDPFTHEADFLGEFIQTTVPTAGFTSFQFRRQDATNYWEVIIEPSQDLTLREVVAGVPAARGVAVGVVNNGDRIVVIADGTTIRVYEQNTLRITYALAANFQTETDGSLLALGVGGAVSDIVTFPRVLSGTALRALDRVADA